jgi:hypothetical protein
MSLWNDKEEIYLKNLNLQCVNMYHYYNKQYIELIQVSKKYNIPIMILSALNSLMALTLSSFMSQQYVSILNAVISAGVGILSSILLFLKINEKINISYMLSLKMNILSLKISKELNIDRKSRVVDGHIFLNDCFNEYLTIIDKSFPLEKRVKNFLKIEDLHEETNNENSSTPSVQLSPINRLFNSKEEIIVEEEPDHIEFEV